MSQPLNRHLTITWAIATVSALCARIWMWFNYPIFKGNDSDTYLHLAASLRNHFGFEKYNGTRTPGYPFFLALINDPNAVYLFQLFMGFITTMLIYWLAYKLTRSAWVALAASLAHTLNIQQLLFEGALLSETLCTLLFFVTLAVLYLFFEAYQKTSTTWLALMVGVVTVLLASVRSLFLTVPFCVILVLIVWKGPRSFFQRLSSLFPILAPMIIALVAWVLYIYLQFNVLGLDSMGGYHKVNFVSSFFEKAPSEYQQITDIFVKYRDARVAQNGSAVNTIWDAIPELMQTTHKNYYALGNLMGAISDELARQNPITYWKNVGLGWLWFWKGGVVWQPEAFVDPLIHTIIIGLVSFERYATVAANAFFVVVSIVFLINKNSRSHPFLYFSAVFIWLTSILQALAEHGDNPRFLAPAQSLVFLFLLVVVFQYYQKKNGRVASP